MSRDASWRCARASDMTPDWHRDPAPELEETRPLPGLGRPGERLDHELERTVRVAALPGRLRRVGASATGGRSRPD